jgi:hypothetical protein
MPAKADIQSSTKSAIYVGAETTGSSTFTDDDINILFVGLDI